MRTLALLIAFASPAWAAERVAAPARATIATLRTALDQCKAATPKGDRCYNLQLALARALIANGEPRPAADIAKKAQEDAQTAWADADDIYISAESRALRPGATAADKAAHVRATAEWKRLWVDQAVALEVSGDANLAAAYYPGATERFSQAASIRQGYGEGAANRDARIRSAGLAAFAKAWSYSMAEGESALRAALVEAQQVQGANGPLAVAIKLNLADILTARTAYGEADSLYRSAREALAPTTPDRIEADARYARFLVRADRKREAEALARDILSRLLARRTDEARIATAYLDIAAAVPHATALPLVQQAVALRMKRFGNRHLETARATIAFARLLEQTGMFAEAEKFRREADIGFTVALSNDHPESATSYLELGENLMRQNRAAQAVGILKIALRRFDDSSGPRSAGAARAALAVAMALVATGGEDPRPYVLRAVPVLREALAVTHRDRLQAEYIVAMMAYHLEGNVPAALRQIRLVTEASLLRARSYPDFGPEAQFEMKEMAPAFTTHVRFAWEAAQAKR